MLLAAIVASEGHAAEPFPALHEGWNAWRVAADESSGTRCCYEWSIGKATMKSCNLDSRSAVSIVNKRQQVADDQVQLYALVKSGTVTKLRALSPRCPVVSTSTITDLGLVANEESLGWLASQVTDDDELGEDALSAIAAHRGGLDVLIATIENEKLPMALRERSLIWIAQSDTDQAFDYLAALLTSR